MYLNYKNIKSGTIQPPMLRLRTLAEKELGNIPFAYGLKLAINYSELSTIEFTVPYQTNGRLNPLYAAISSYKVVYTDELGIYLITSASKSGDGIEETKTVQGYSLEQTFSTKNLYLSEGTYNFWNPVDSGETILGRIIELDPTWHVGYVAPRLIGCYRTFDEYDDDALSFLYSDAMEKYRCAVVFDVYEKSINAYDANEDAETLPIYLNYKNLVSEVEVEEIMDDFCTKLHLYGSDSLTIRDVNPLGTDYIVNLDYFLNNGDLDIVADGSTLTMAERVKNWQASIAAKQTYYSGLAAMRASLTAQKLAAEATLTDLQGELDTLTSEQSVTIQAYAMETTDDGIAYQQTLLDDLYTKIAAKQAEIDTAEANIESLETSIEKYKTQISAVAEELSISNYFTETEQKILNLYLIEGDLEEETFVASDVDTEDSGAISTITGTVSVTDSTIYMVELTDFSKTMYTLSGGTLTITSAELEAEIIRSTMEQDSSGNCVFTGYLGTTSYSGHSFGSGLITISGSVSSISSDIGSVTEDEVTEYKGTELSFQTSNADTYFTVTASEFKTYSVELELYDFGSEALDDYAWPVYEFSVSSANFLYHEKFEPFKNKLELGKAVHLELGSEGLINAKVIGVELDFDDISSFELVFSNQYQRKNGVSKLIDELQSASRTSKSFDASKYLYNRAADKTTQIDEFMTGQLNAAVNNIVNKTDQTILINGSGIHVGGDSDYQIRIVDNMIAMTDDNWKTAKLAIGLFASEETGEQWGVNAEVIAGKLIVGNNLVLQNPTDDGFMMFQVDSTGAWLYNATFVLQDDSSGGCILLDPDYGIVAGNGNLFTTDGTTVKPSFIDDDGNITLDSDGMPTNANFYIDIDTGDAYLRGTVTATAGKIGGWTLKDDYLYGGSSSSFVALNGSSSNDYSLYAIWAGATSPASAPFWVKKDGSVNMNNATVKGKLYASGLLDSDGNNMLDDDDKISSDYLNLKGITITDSDGDITFQVDTSGNVTIGGTVSGTITMGQGSTINWNYVDDNGAYALAESAVSDAADAANTAANAVHAANTAKELAIALANGEYDGGTFISETMIYSPTISSPEIYGGTFYAVSGNTSNYSTMTSSGFHTYLDGLDKAFLGVSSSWAFPGGSNVLPSDDDSSSSNFPTFYLGAGSYSGLRNKLVAQKAYDSQHIACIGLTGSSGTIVSGFEFFKDGTITVQGTLTATAVFG